MKHSHPVLRCVHASRPLLWSQQRFLVTTCKGNEHRDIRSFEDLAKLDSLDGVDPELVKRLINKRAQELNLKNEMDMLKQLQNEEKAAQEVPLKKFVRPLWIFLIMSSSVYLGMHYLWWKLDYEKCEAELQRETNVLESKLEHLVNSQQNDAMALDTKYAHQKQASWSRWIWFWR